MATEEEEREAKRKKRRDERYPPDRMRRWNWEPDDFIPGEEEKVDYREEK